MATQAPEEDYTIANPDVVTKYKVAGDISGKVLANVKALAVAGAKIIDLVTEGDRQLTEETSKVYKGKKIAKGIAFPTSVSPNAVVAHLSPMPQDPEAEQTLKEGDVVKITLGAQIDGFASVVADTIVVGGPKAASAQAADAIAAAWYASEAALRTIRPGNKNWDVTKVVDKVVKEFGCSALEGMLSQEQTRNVVDGKKRIILNPTEGQRKDFETVTFEQGEVYGVDILVTPGDGKVKSGETATTVFKKNDITYQLKLKTSRMILSEVQKKAGTFPFSLRSLDDAKRARMGLQECTNHGLVTPYEVLYDKEGLPVIQFFTTIAVTANGNLKLAGAPTPELTSEKKIADQDVLDLLSKPLKTNKKKKKAAKAE
uniref:ARAD1C18612p n=1 Tax=Blastobotrys adeninivorans TaxID=409370 RepID=A0A060T1T0_BLAAD